MFGTALYSPWDKVIPLFFPHDAKPQNQQPKTTAAAKQPAFQALSDQHPEAKSRQTAAMQMIPSAHKNTPGIAYALQKQKRTFRKIRKVLKCKCNEPGEPSGVTTTAAA
jgi:hypothetical protein